MLEVYYEKYVYVPKDPETKKLNRNKFRPYPYYPTIPDSRVAWLRMGIVHARITEKVKNFPTMTSKEMEYVLKDFFVWIYREYEVKEQLKCAKDVLERMVEERFGESPAYYLYMFLLYVLAIVNVDEDWNISNETIAGFSRDMCAIDRRLFW